MVRWLRKLAIWLALILAGLCLAFLMLRSRYREVIRDLAQTQVKNTTSDLTNDAIAKQIAQGIIRYDRIVFFEKDLDGRITALKTNMSEVNRLKTQILDILNDTLLEISTDKLSIPIGNLILPELFSGRGPGIPLMVLSISTSDASFRNAFTSAGINQTCHQIILIVEVAMTVLLPTETINVAVTSEMVVAETIIVGDVPTTYATF